MKVSVVSVTGQAEKLLPGQGQQDTWTALSVGEELGELTIIRTGLRSKVTLKLQDRGEVMVGSGTKIGIAEFRKRGSLVTTQLGLKYGTMHASVDSSRGPNDAKVTTPVATLSIRGSAAQIGVSGDRGLGLRARSGNWRVAAGQRTRNIVAGESTDSQLTQPVVILKQQRSNILGDLFGGLSDAEKEFFTNNDSSPGDLLSNQFGTSLNTDTPSDHIIIGQ